MPRLIWVFAGRTVTLLVLSCRGSNGQDDDQTRVPFQNLFVFPPHITLSLIEHNKMKNWALRYCTACLVYQFYLVLINHQNSIDGSMSLIKEPRHDKTNKMAVHPAKTQISLGIRPVWSESLLSAQWVAMDPSFLHVDNEDSDQTGRMPRLIWVFAGRTVTLLVLSCRGSKVTFIMQD